MADVYRVTSQQQVYTLTYDMRGYKFSLLCCSNSRCQNGSLFLISLFYSMHSMNVLKVLQLTADVQMPQLSLEMSSLSQGYRTFQILGGEYTSVFMNYGVSRTNTVYYCLKLELLTMIVNLYINPPSS